MPTPSSNAALGRDGTPFRVRIVFTHRISSDGISYVCVFFKSDPLRVLFLPRLPPGRLAQPLTVDWRRRSCHRSHKGPGGKLERPQPAT